MDTAFELETQKIVKAWLINRDSSYIKPEEDIFYANPDEIKNYVEVLENNNIDYIEVRYKKGHDRRIGIDKTTFVRPHFFIKNKEKLGVELIPETPEHKKIKNFIYDYFFDNEETELVYSKYKRKGEYIEQTIKLKDLPINWNDFSLSKEDIFEIGITDTFNTRRVDVFLKFDNFHPLWGEGIVIEVQLTSQSEKITQERTLDRALKGYSTIWITKNNFIDYKSDFLELNDKKLNINCWHSVIQYDSEIIERRIHDKIKKYSRLFDQKIISLDEKINDSKIELDNIHNNFMKNTIIREGMLCPLCKTGQLTRKKSNYGDFLGCSNYKSGCKANYKIIEGEKNE